MGNSLEYLRSNINDNSSLLDIVKVFEKICETKINDDSVLFETGTFNFTGEPLFYFSLVKQYEGTDDEYVQIHVDVLYKPTKANSKFSKSVWYDDIDNISEKIIKSKAFQKLQDEKIFKVHIFENET
jgi:hypothetical protein